MKSILPVFISLLLASSASYGNPALLEEGRMLFEEGQCMACHQARPFNGPNSKIKTWSGLNAMVEACNTNLSIGWFPDEVEAVSYYLNRQYYGFPTLLKHVAE